MHVKYSRSINHLLITLRWAEILNLECIYLHGGAVVVPFVENISIFVIVLHKPSVDVDDVLRFYRSPRVVGEGSQAAGWSGECC